MPEIKNTFTQGKMNKDLDERLIPNGQYREALNVKVSVSDESDVGTVQNILGNERLDSIIPAGFKCIGSISNEKTNKLYWFVTKPNLIDAIVQYDLENSNVELVLVDTKQDTLKFTEKIITGINIIDNLLFFTDGYNEPKKINIDSCIAGTTTTDLNLATHTELIVDGDNKGDINESHITVIRKNPKSQLDVIINKPTGQTSTKLFEKIFPRFSYRYKYQDGEYSAFGPFTDVVFNALYNEDYSQDDAYSSVESYNTAMVNNIKSVELKNFVTSHTPKDVVQIEILYKQEGSNVVFSIKKINYDTDPSSDWTNNSCLIESESIYSAIPENQILRVFDAVPTKALAQEITGNRLIYGNYTQGHSLLNPFGNTTTADFFKADYGVRNIKKSFNDGGIQSVKSQRKYQVGFVLGDKYGRETPVFTSDDGFVEIPWYNYEKSDIGLSASQTLQITARSGLGITSPQAAPPHWAEYYKYYIKETSSEYYNLIMDKAYIPSRLNVFDNEEDHVWITFPSSDRNKVSEEDYLILKKLVGGNEEQVSLENKFKILAIDNEAPDQIKFDYLSLGLATQNTAGVTSFLTNSTSGLMRDATYRIDQETDMVYVRRDAWINDCAGGSLTDDGDNENMYVNNMYMSFENRVDNVETSEKYKVVSILFVNDNYQVKLNRKITLKDAQLADVNGVANDTTNGLKADLVLKFERKEQKDLDEFSGKFFVKIVASRAAVNNIEYNAQPDLTSQFIVSIKKPIRWYVESADGGSNPTTGLINGSYPTLSTANKLDVINGGATLTNTEVAWASVMTQNSGYAGSNYDGDSRTFFIDNAYFVAGQIDDNNYARQSGQTYRGSGVQYYPEPVWDGSDPARGWTTNAGSFYYNTSTSTGYVFDTKPLYYNLQVGSTGEIVVNKDINGLEGYVQTTGPSHTASDHEGYRVWLKGKIQDRFDFDYTVYSQQDGKHYLHLSFLGPGVDLHSGFAPLGVTTTSPLVGPGSIADNLQGIWGGGYFSENGTTLFMEGNYDANGDALFDPPAPGVGQGYDNFYKDQHENQWNPAYPESEDTDGAIRDFVNNLKKNSKFKFSNDTNDTVITIVSDVQTKKLYNHTPWRAYKAWDGVSTNNNGTNVVSANIVLGGNSVEEAAVAWVQDTSDPVKLTTLKNRIENFGKRNNRRICYIFEIDQDITSLLGDTNLLDANGDGSSPLVDIEFLSKDPNILTGKLRDVAAIWETEPKIDEGLDIYYEASSAYPFVVNEDTNELLAPVGSRVEILNLEEARVGEVIVDEDIFVQEWLTGTKVSLTSGFNVKDASGSTIDYDGKQIRFYKDDGSFVTLRIKPTPNFQSNTVAIFDVDPTIDASLEQGLSWNNCFSFGNGIESNRIRDDFNAPQITNGVKASITLEQDYKEEHRKSGLIFSGIYNSTSSVNNLNQFIQAEKITKDLNPTYGSIQKLFQRRISLVAFCEDRVVSITSNKDSLFNADGNPQLISSTNVLGDATPFVGDYGISKNPESFAKESYRAYFTDKQRGAVLRLSMDGLTPISEAGMADFFRDNLKLTDQLIGSYDNYNKYYNLTISDRLPTPNLISNGTITDGTQSVLATNANRILNGSVNGTTLQFPTIDMSVDNVTDNSTLDSQAIIANFAEIPQYSIVPETFTVIPPTQSTFLTFSTTSFNLISASFTDPTQNPFYGTGTGNHVDRTYQIYRNYTSNYVTNGVPQGNLGNSVSTFPTPGYGGSGPYNYNSKSANWYTGFSPQFPTANLGASEDIFWNHTSDLYNSQTSPGNQAPFGTTSSNDNPWFNTNDGDNHGLGACFDSTDVGGQAIILPGVHIPDGGTPNTSTLTQAVKDKYPAATDLTIFNGEEIKITFYFRNGYNEASGSTDNDRSIYLELIDGSSGTFGTDGVYTGYTALSDSNVWDTTTGSGFTDTNFSTTHGSPGSSTYEVGYADGSASYNFPVISNNNNVFHEIFFKFTDGTEDESVVIDNLQVLLRPNSTDNNHTDLYGAISSVSITKVHRVTDVDTFTSGSTTANGDGIPSQTIPAFATVRHGVDNWDEASTYITPQSIATYGNTFWPPATITETVTHNGNVININYEAPPGTVADVSGYGLTTLGPTDNGTVVYNDGTGGAGMYGTYTTPVYTSNNYGGTSDYNFVFGQNPPSPSYHGTSLINDEIKTNISGNSIVEQVHYDFIEDNWYVIDLLYTGGVFSSGTPAIELKLPVDQVNGVQAVFTPQQVDDFYSTTTNIYRCLFQATAANGWNASTSDYIRIETTDAEITITDIYVADITQSYQGGTAPNWNINGITQPVNYFSVPEIYVDNTDGFVFTENSTSAQNVRQLLPNLPQTTDGYILEFEIKNNALHTQINGNNSYGEFKVTVSNGTSNFRAELDAGGSSNNGIWTIEAKLGTVGTNNISQNGVVVGSTIVAAQPAFSGIEFTQLPNPNKIMVGSVDNISLIDKTNYFLSGGSVDSFAITGFDPLFNDYIDFNVVPGSVPPNGQISFNNAPRLAPRVQIEQLISGNLNTGNTYKLQFNHLSVSGDIKGYYFNNAGEGFRFTVPTGDGTYTMNHVIGDDTIDNSAGELSNTFVIYADDDVESSGIIDNILLQQVFTGLETKTVSYSEKVRGWVSFKSFVLEQGTSLANNYYTFYEGGLYLHNSENEPRNNFYGIQYNSSITAVLNDSPSVVKYFNTLNYEGSQSEVVAGNINSGFEVYNENAKDGWLVDYIQTDKQRGSVKEFIEKEGKWFNYIKGDDTDLDTGSLSFQGLGVVKNVTV